MLPDLYLNGSNDSYKDLQAHGQSLIWLTKVIILFNPYLNSLILHGNTRVKFQHHN